MQKTSLICNNFSGINRGSSIFNESIVTATDLQNVDLFSTETNSGIGIRTALGNISVCDLIPENELVVNIFESIQKSLTYFFVHTENTEEGKIYLFLPDTGELILKASGLKVTGKSSAVDVAQGWDDFWVFSNSEEILSIQIGHYDEDSNLDEVQIITPKDTEGQVVKGLGLVVFDGRLWIFSQNRLWYSVQEDAFDFATLEPDVITSAGYIEFVKNITAIYPYLGSLAVFHSNSSCLISLDEADKSYYKTSEFVGGCASYASLVFHGTSLYFYDDTKKGVFSFQQVVNGDKTLGENIAFDIQEELFSIPTRELHNLKALSVVTADRNEIWFLLPSEESKYSTIMIYDYLRKSWVKRKSQKINTINIIASRFYSAGKKIYEEYNSLNFDGEFIPAYYKCAPLNLGVEYSLKILSYPPKITVDMYYSNKFYVEYTKDYNSLTTKIRHINSKTLNNVLYFDNGLWDESFYPYEKINAIKKLPTAYFRTLQMGFFTQKEGENFCINNIEFGKIRVKT